MGLSGVQASRNKQQEMNKQQALMSAHPEKHQDPSTSTRRMVRAEQGGQGTACSSAKTKP